MAFLLFHLKENRFVLDDVLVTEVLYIDEIVAQEYQMLDIKYEGLYCKITVQLLVVTFVHHPMSTLPYFVAYLILFAKSGRRLVLLIRLYNFLGVFGQRGLGVYQHFGGLVLEF